MAWRVCLAGLVVVVGFAHLQLHAQGVIGSLPGRQLVWPLPRPAAGSPRSFAARSPTAVANRDPPLHAFSPAGALHSRPPDGGDGKDGAAGNAETFRTLCVRMCDGYYFPLSFSIARGGLAHDADMCTASCGGEARLFYHPNPGGGIDSMVDLTGRAYTELPNAFKYRQTLVDGCRCRPQPWSPSELSRHRSYAQPAAAPSSVLTALTASQAEGAAFAPNGETSGVGDPATRSAAPSFSLAYHRPSLRMDDGHMLARPDPVARDLPQMRPPQQPSPYGSDWAQAKSWSR